MNKEAVEKLAKEHWDYVKELINVHTLLDEETLAMLRFHYITAFIHGYKHAIDERKESSNHFSIKISGLGDFLKNTSIHKAEED